MKRLFGAVAIAVAAIYSPLAHAAYSATFQGVTFNVDIVDPNTLSFEIVGALDSATGDWASATKLGAFSFKDLGLDFSTTTATATYTDPNPDVVTPGVRDELSNSHATVDCVAQISGEKGSVCFDFVPDIQLTNDMHFLLDFSNNFNIAANGPHLKIAFTDNAGGKVGSLYSQNIAASSTTSSTSSTSGISSTGVPEPGSTSLAFLGLGLLGLSFWKRRKAG